MTFTKDQLDQIKASVPLWKIVAARIPRYEQVNGEFAFKCPWHKDGKERTPSLKVYKKNGVWMCTCFGECSQSWNGFQFIQKFDQVSFADAVRKMEADTTFTPIMPAEKKAELTFALSDLALAEKSMWNSSEALVWLRSRGIQFCPTLSDTTTLNLSKLHLGFVQSAKAVSPKHPNVDGGWVLFPNIDEKGVVTSLKYRSIVGKDFLHKTGMKTGVYNLGAVEPLDEVFVVEGELDAITLIQAGYAAVSLPGASYVMKPEERDRLLQASAIFLAGDTDAPGRQAMEKLWTELRDRTYRIEWPNLRHVQKVDANDYFVLDCGADIPKFQSEIERLKLAALETPIPHVYNLRETLLRTDTTNPLDHPARMRMPWAGVDQWTAILPGDVVILSASQTGMGKSTWLMNVLLHNALRYGKTIVNYTAEIMPEQYARRVASHLMRKDRMNLSPEDFKAAAKMLESAQFYNGYKPGALYKDVTELLKWTKRRVGADIIVVDPLPFLIRGLRDQYAEEANAMRMLKDLAFEFNVIVVVVTQPRKGMAGQNNREMTGQDISGSYTQNTDASQVFLLHRDRVEETTEGSPVFSSETKVILDKSRESETRVARLFFEGATCTFLELDNRPEPMYTKNRDQDQELFA